MAKQPVPSVVVRASKPSAAQSALAQQQRAAALAAQARAGMTGPGGTYASGAVPTAANLGLAGRGNVRPVQVNRNGLVTNPANSVGALTAGRQRTATPKPAPKKTAAPRVRVVVHPSGKIEVHQAAPTSPAASAAAGAGTALAAASHSGKYQTDARGRTDTTLNLNPNRTPAPRTAATVAPAPSVNDQAQAILDPVKQSILDAINQRVNAQQQAITNYSKDLASMMGQYGPAAAAGYSNAETGQAAIDAALAQTLQGAGASGQADLAGRLAKIDADPGTAARLNGAAAQTTQGAVGAAAGRGAASLSALIGQKADAQDYGAKLPGVAGLYGLQATKSAQAQGTTDTANAVSQLEQQLPSVVQTIKTDTNQNKQLRFEHGVALLQANGGVVTPQIKALLGGALPVGPAAKTAPKADSTLSKAFGYLVDSSGSPILRGGKTVSLPKSSTTTTRKANASLSKSLGYVVDNSGEPLLQNGQKVMLPKAAPKQTATAAKDKAKALGLARIGHTPTTVNGVEHPAVSWQQYLSTGLSQGIPAATLIEQGKKVYTRREIKLGLIPGVNGG